MQSNETMKTTTILVAHDELEKAWLKLA